MPEESYQLIIFLRTPQQLTGEKKTKTKYYSGKRHCAANPVLQVVQQIENTDRNANRPSLTPRASPRPAKSL